MKLIWKLLRRHISLPQFAGFSLANLFGMLAKVFWSLSVKVTVSETAEMRLGAVIVTVVVPELPLIGLMVKSVGTAQVQAFVASTVKVCVPPLNPKLKVFWDGSNT